MRRGFTLIETIIYTVLVVMVLTSVVLATQTALQLRGRSRIELLLTEGVRFALTHITERIQTANDLTSPTDVGIASNTLTITVPEVPQTPTTFTLTNGVITAQKGGGTAEALTADVITITELSFTRLIGSPPPVSITITGNSGTGSRRAEISLTTFVVLE
jgi:Tfp pilus assembly protein PilE